MSQQQSRLFSRYWAQPGIIISVCYLSLNTGLALLMVHSFLLGLAGIVFINLLVLFFLHYRWMVPLYILIAAPSLILPIESSGLLSRLFVGNVLLVLLALVGLVRTSLFQRKSITRVHSSNLIASTMAIASMGVISIMYSRIQPDLGVLYAFQHSDVSLTIVNSMECILLLGFPIILLVMPSLVQSRRDVIFILAAFTFLGMLYSLATIFAGPLGLYSQQVILNIRRPQVFGSSSSNLGLLLVFFVCVTFGQALYTKRHGPALGWWVLTGIFCVAVVLSFGRTAWLTLCLSVLVMLSLYTRTIAILPFILVLLLLSFIPGVSNFFNPDKVYGFDRLIMWQDAIDIWQRHPFFGIGAGNYQFFDIAYGKDVGGVAHNQYLEVLAEMGIQGLICLIWSILVVGYLAFKRFRNATTALGKAFALSYLGYYIGLIFFGFFADSFLPSVAGAGGTAAIIEASYNWFLFGVVLTIPQWERSFHAAGTAEICREKSG